MKIINKNMNIRSESMNKGNSMNKGSKSKLVR